MIEDAALRRRPVKSSAESGRHDILMYYSGFVTQHPSSCPCSGGASGTVLRLSCSVLSMTCTGVAAKRSFQSFTVNWAKRTNDRAGAKPWLSGRHGHSRGWCAAPSGLRFDLMRPYGGDASCQCRRDDGAAQAGADHSKTPPDIWPIRPSISAVFPTRSEHSRRTLWSARARHRHEPAADRGGRCRHCSPGQVIRYRQRQH